MTTKKTATEALRNLDRIESSLNNDSMMGFSGGYELAKAVLYIREYLQEKETPKK